MRINLSVIEGPHKGREFSFEEHQNFIVGRGKLAHFRLPDRFFSRIHFMVEINPPLCRLMDMGSTNRTRVNGREVTSVELEHGDLIEAGKTTLQVSLLVDVPATGADAPDAAPLPSLPACESLGIFGEPKAPPTGPYQRAAAAHQPLTTVFVARTDATGPPDPSALGARCAGCGSAVTPTTSSRSPSPGPYVCSECETRAQGVVQPIEGYLLIRELGRGGMGIVYLALRRDDGALVALKTVRPAVSSSATQLERFLREARILEQLDHPHIIAFRAVGESNGLLYFAMDYVVGQDAAQLQKHLGGPLPVARAVRLIDQMLDGLSYAHARGFVHRDVKPANLLVEGRGGREFAHLSDFGLARTYQASRMSGLTVQGEHGGTIAYMAPEQITHFRDSKPTVDQYAAAASLYQLLTNQLIYDLPRRYEAQILMVLQDDPIPILKRRADLPAKLAEVVHRALAREPETRFSDVAAFRAALRPFG